VILIRSITLRDGAKPIPNKKPRRSGAGSLSAASVDVKLIGLASARGSFMRPNFSSGCDMRRCRWSVCFLVQCGHTGRTFSRGTFRYGGLHASHRDRRANLLYIPGSAVVVGRAPGAGARGSRRRVGAIDIQQTHAEPAIRPRKATIAWAQTYTTSSEGKPARCRTSAIPVL
jgi:hypothetical protein